jgi:signal transduction histidine kinase
MLKSLPLVYNNKDILKEIRRNDEKNQATAAVGGAVGQSMWFLVDFYMLPGNKLIYFVWHFVAIIIPLLLVAFRKKIGIDGSLCHFIAVIFMASVAPYIIIVCSSDNIIIFTIGCIIILIGSGLLGVWSFWWSFNFKLGLLMSILVSFVSFGEMDLSSFIFYFFIPVSISAFISLLILRGRMKIFERELIMNKILEKSKDDLQKNKEKIKSELDFLIYCISHDLRSPILSVKGLLMLVRDAQKLNEENKQYLLLAENSVERLDQTIFDLMDYADNAGFNSRQQNFNLRVLVREIFDDLRFLSKQSIDFEIEIDGSDEVFSDKKRIKTVIKNLASNAVKYSRNDGIQAKVLFQLKHFPDRFEFCINDNGIGIVKEEQTKIFEMFYRCINDSMGSGLGLFIVKEALAKIGGKIYVESELGIGSAFSVIIPCK